MLRVTASLAHRHFNKFSTCYLLETRRHKILASTRLVPWSIRPKSSGAESARKVATTSSTTGKDEGGESNQVQIHCLLDGKPLRFGTGTIANLAEASVIGTAGNSVALAVVSTDSSKSERLSSTTSASILSEGLHSTEDVGFTVSYQERFHGVGKIPLASRIRRDTGSVSEDEILAGRIVDRALRPLLKSTLDQIHVSCSIQAHDGRGNPVVLALNSASVALGRRKRVRSQVAAVHLCLDKSGSVITDPTYSQAQEAAACLLYAGTRDHVVMMEASSATQPIPEDILIQLMELAHSAIQPILDIQESLILIEDEQPTDREIFASLALSLPISAKSASADSVQLDHESLLKDATIFCQSRLGDAPMRLFGVTEAIEESASPKNVSIHGNGRQLLTKSIRGRQEHLLSKEIERLLTEEYVPYDFRLRDVFVPNRENLVSPLANAVRKKMFQNALFVSSSKFQARGDKRGYEGNGTHTIRPLATTVPALPDVVHGSSLFSRGETQVLCTATLGAPRDGVPLTHPYQEPKIEPREPSPFDDLPVGSLRYLRSQEAMVSDFNSKKVKADKEMTGDSGTFDEVRRFFLQYDFPSFSNGQVPSGRGNRREVGHGKLAEKAVEPVIPHPSDFPYSIRVTSEVTSSNGSSSMATVCGATLALLDAGVPLIAPVAGVSVGLALGETLSDYCLLLDITGTEDHYGWMDFKIAGTVDGVTALHLDVKTPLPMNILFEGLHLGREGRVKIMEEMEQLSKASSAGIISKLLPRPVLKDSAPRVEVVRFNPLRKKALIGPGGAVLRQLEDRFDVSIDLTQEGQCLLFGHDHLMVNEARAAVMDLVAEVEEGHAYIGTVVEIKDFGAVVELLRNKEGLLHVTEISGDMAHPDGNFGVVNHHLRVGQKIEVLCTGVDEVQGYIRLSRRALLEKKANDARKRVE